jgi:integrase
MYKEKFAILPKLYDGGGDLKKRWFIYYSVKNPATFKMERFKVYGDLSKKLTISSRYALAKEMILEYSKKLRDGWTPFEENREFLFNDEILYANTARIFGSEKKSGDPIRIHLSKFLELEKIRVAPKTYESYQSKTRLFCEWLEHEGYGKGIIADLTTEVIQEFFHFLITKRKLCRRTVEKYQQNLTALFEYLIKNKKIKENPVKDIPRVGLVVDYAPKPILAHDLIRLKEAIIAKDLQLWLACQFQYYCFIRPGTELRLMKIQSINFEAGIVTIPNALAKNRRTETVQIPKIFLKALKDVYHLDQYPHDYYVFGREGEPGTEPHGKNTMRIRFNVIRDELGLSKEYKFYSWKHTGATAAVDAGIPERHLMDQLRHKSFEATDHYFRRHRGYQSPAIKENFPEL